MKSVKRLLNVSMKPLLLSNLVLVVIFQFVIILDLFSLVFKGYCTKFHKTSDVVGLAHIYQTPIVPISLGGKSIKN